MKLTIISVMIIAVAMIMPMKANSDSIVGSAHDLSKTMKDPNMAYWDNYNDYNEVCVYCHTPHNARVDAGAPLWNRQDPTTNYTLYSSSSLSSQPGQPGPQSMVCLSCHDGTISVDAVINAPTSTTWENWENPSYPGYNSYHGRMQGPEAPDYYAFRDCGGCHGDNPIASRSLSATFISTTLADDHPINITYPVNATSDFKPVAEAEQGGAKLYAGKVECLSCHNVHNPQYGSFLIKSNSGSAVCYTCHTK